MIADKLFEVIKDDYTAWDKRYKKTFGYSMGSKKELLNAYSKGTNIVQYGPGGEVQGFLNYIDHGDWFDFKTLAIRKELRDTFSGAKLAYGLFNKMMDKAREKNVRYIDLVLLTLENTIHGIAEKAGFKIESVIDESRILLRKEGIK